MAESVRIPRLGIGMTEGTLTQWMVTDGDSVEVGTPLFLLETDKVENEISATAAGTVRLVGEAGETYAVGDEIGTIG